MAPSRRSTRQIAPRTSIPAARAFSIASPVDFPCVHTSSMMTTGRPLVSSSPSINRSIPCFFGSFRTMKALIGCPKPAKLSLAIEKAIGSAPTVNPPTAFGVHPHSLILRMNAWPTSGIASGEQVVSLPSTYLSLTAPEESLNGRPVCTDFRARISLSWDRSWYGFSCIREDSILGKAYSQMQPDRAKINGGWGDNRTTTCRATVESSPMHWV